MAALTLRFVGLDAGIVRGVIGDIHRPAAPRLGTGEMFVLEGLDKPTTGFSFLIR